MKVIDLGYSKSSLHQGFEEGLLPQYDTKSPSLLFSGVIEANSDELAVAVHLLFPEAPQVLSIFSAYVKLKVVLKYPSLH